MECCHYLELCMSVVGVDSRGVDAMFPVTDEEFDKFREALKQKITSFTVSIFTAAISQYAWVLVLPIVLVSVYPNICV